MRPAARAPGRAPVRPRPRRDRGGSWRTQSPLLPPLLAMSRTRTIVTPRSTPLTMSYTVSAATDAAVMASISTPVWPVVAASARIRSRPPARSGVIETCRSVSGNGWQSGISSLVFLPPMTPASSATPSTSPFGPAAIDDEAERLRRHRDRRLGDGPSSGDGLGRHVDHARPPAAIDVGEAPPLRAWGSDRPALGSITTRG